MSSRTIVPSLFASRESYRRDAEAIELPASAGKPMSISYSELADLVHPVSYTHLTLPTSDLV